MPVVTTTVHPDNYIRPEQFCWERKDWSRDQQITALVVRELPRIVQTVVRREAKKQLELTEVQSDQAAFTWLAQNAPYMWIKVEPPMGLIPDDLIALVRDRIKRAVVYLVVSERDEPLEGIIVDIWPVHGSGVLHTPGQPDVTW